MPTNATPWPCAYVARIAPLLAALAGSPAWGHGGGLNADGCHFNRKTGDYHCHRGNLTPSAVPQPPVHAPGGQTARGLMPSPPTRPAGPTCYTGPRGGTYTITPSGRKNYSGC